jgi:hypothetical protein
LQATWPCSSSSRRPPATRLHPTLARHQASAHLPDTATGRPTTTSPRHRHSSSRGCPCMAVASTRPRSPATSAP